MSHALHKQLMSTVDALDKVNEVLKDNFEKVEVNQEQIVGLLSDCQDTAVAMGSMIEGLYGKGTGIVTELEAYCSYLYPLAMKLCDWSGRIQILGQMEEHVSSLRILIEQEVPNRLEVVFFPYKASMWDSLESVYLAAKADTTNDVYCVPIPYFDRNPDQSLGSMHYEGAEYPKNIEITDWQNYNFEERRPDVIYIHNPYDDQNLITCVHPRFFSRNLKKYTDELVYIPYFVLEDIKPDNTEQIERMKHFCSMPGVIYADKVILQSENMRQIYINEFRKAALLAGLSKESISKKKLEEKFLGVGSPKFDKILNTRKEDIKIPPGWLECIITPDGDWKKIIFYNTGLNSLLNNNEKLLKKTRDVLQIFKENKDRITLLWRPHPLIQAALKSMRPDLWNEYHEIVEKYKKEGWGIYDDSTDIDRAVAISDAYYGDDSSVVQLFQRQKKKCMIQKLDVDISYNTPIFVDMVQQENCLWFVSGRDNAIYKMDEETWMAELVAIIPDDAHVFSRMQYGEVAYYNKKLFFIPLSSDKIIVYEMNTGKIRQIAFGVEEECRKSELVCDGIKTKCVCKVMIDRYLYLIPFSFNSIVVLDMETESILKDKCIKLSDSLKLYSSGMAELIDNNIVFSSLSEDNLYKIKLENNQVEKIKIPFLCGGGNGIHYDGYKLWIVPKKTDKIILYDVEKNIFRTIQDFPVNYISGEWSFRKLFATKNKLYLLPRMANMILCIDKYKDTIKEIILNDKIERNNIWNRYMPYPYMRGNDNRKYIFSSEKGNVFCLDENDELINKATVGYAPCNKSISNQWDKIYLCQDKIIEYDNIFQNIYTFIKKIVG